MSLSFHIATHLFIYIMLIRTNAPTGINFTYSCEFNSCRCISLNKNNINQYLCSYIGGWEHTKNLEWLVETEERYGSNVPEGRYIKVMFGYATPNNIFALRLDCLLYSHSIILDFWYVFNLLYSYIPVNLDYFYSRKCTYRN
jgi:hypothetical protein